MSLSELLDFRLFGHHSGQGLIYDLDLKIWKSESDHFSSVVDALHFDRADSGSCRTRTTTVSCLTNAAD